MIRTTSSARRPRRLSRTEQRRRAETRNEVLLFIGALVFGLPATLLAATCYGAVLANDFTVIHAIGKLFGL